MVLCEGRFVQRRSGGGRLLGPIAKLLEAARSTSKSGTCSRQCLESEEARYTV
jgi:hypothetical protein